MEEGSENESSSKHTNLVNTQLKDASQNKTCTNDLEDTSGSSSSSKKRKTLLRTVIDSDHSDSDIEITKRTKAAKLDHSEESSDSDVVSKKKKNKNKPLIEDLEEDINNSESNESDCESDNGFEECSNSDWTSDSDCEVVQEEEGAEKKKTEERDASSNSSDSDGESDKCPICLMKFKDQEVGSPESCDHSFCLECIQEWSKNVNTCPVDRQTFNLILVRRHIEGRVVRHIPVEVQSKQPEEVLEEDQTFCEVCGRSDREDRMLLCDGCDLGYHLECLDPPLDFIPVEEWYCSDCLNQSDGPMADMVEIYEGELDLLWEDAEATIGRPANSTRRRPAEQRLVPRTRASERVRATIAIHRNTRGGQQIQDDPNEASSSSAPAAVGSRSSGSVTRRRIAASAIRTTTVTRRKRKKRKRKAPKKRVVMYELDEYGKKFAVRKSVRKRRSKKKRKRTVRTKIPKSAKTRLANQLGMVCRSNKTGQLLPDVKQSNGLGTPSTSITHQRSQAGIPTLHLFGHRDELDYFYGSDSDNDSGGASMGSGGMAMMVARPRTRTSALERQAMRRKGIAAAASSSAATVVSSNVPDLLSSILDSQTKFHSKNSVLSLKNDGSIDVQTPKGTSNRNRIRVDGENSVPTRQAPSSSPDADVATPSSTTPHSVSHSNVSASSRYQQNSECSGAQNQSGRLHASSASGGGGGMDGNGPEPLDYSGYDAHKREGDDKKADNGDKKNETDEEIDIYSDIEQGDGDVQDDDIPEVQELHAARNATEPNVPSTTTQQQEEDRDSDNDLVIDDTVKAETEKYDPSQAFDEDESDDEDDAKPDADAAAAIVERGVTSGMVDLAVDKVVTEHLNAVMSKSDNVEDDDEDDCPNFSIYSTESLNFARDRDIQVNVLNSTEITPEDDEKAKRQTAAEAEAQAHEQISAEMEDGELQNTYEDDDEDLIADSGLSKSAEGDVHSSASTAAVRTADRQDKDKDNGEPMTEDISDEERTYTPCLDEKDHLYDDDDNNGGTKKGIGGLDTELISDEERNDIFDESHDLKTVSDGDALEINAKESELDFTKPDDYEEGEIVEKAGAAQKSSAQTAVASEKPSMKKPAPPKDVAAAGPKKKSDREKGESSSKKEKRKSGTGGGGGGGGGDDKNKENNDKSKNSFKKLSKSNKDRNYRDKEKGRKSRSKSREAKKDKENRKERARKEKRKDLERYDVRSLISDRPKSNKDKFGRDEARNRSPSVSSRSPSVRRSFSPRRRSPSRDRGPKRRKRSPRKSRSYSLSRSRSRERRSRSRSSLGGRRRRERSLSKGKRKGRNRSSPTAAKPPKQQRKGSRTRKDSKRRSRSPSLRRRRDWTPSWSRSPSPLPRDNRGRNGSPSWTPPLMEKASVAPQNFTVILPNDSSAKNKKKDKRRKADKKSKEAANAAAGDKQRKRRRSERSPPPSKEVFTSGDNILVSVSFNNENGTAGSKRRRDSGVQEPKRKANREKRKRDGAALSKNRTDLSNLKPVAIIDLEKSPFKELTPSPKDVIVLSDSDQCEKELQKAVCDSSQQDTSYTGPKTPPEPQIKFLIASKQTQMRPIINPLHEPDEGDEEIDPQEELEQRLNDVLHKGPNTPPEPPISAPSSPDVYDPFDPTKSRSPTPTPADKSDGNADGMDGVATQKIMDDNCEKQAAPIAGKNDGLENGRSHTPPLTVTEVQAADSQSSGVRAVTPDSEATGGDGPSTQPSAASVAAAAFAGIVKSSLPSTVIQYSNTATSLSISTPALLASVIAPRYNTTPPGITSTPNRGIAAVNKTPLLKSSPIKAAQIKPSPVKSAPVKSTSAKGASSRKKRSGTKKTTEVIELDFESPYSPGSSDYEDLFEPPTESAGTSAPKSSGAARKSSGKKSGNAQSQKNANSSGGGKSAFDVLFGTSPNFKNAKKPSKSSSKKKSGNSGSKSNTKTQVGVKIDEENLKILDELPNSAVEMQVKDKFLKKLNRQERVVEEVKLVLKPHYNKKHINKEEYKDILRRSVPKICHNKSGEINPKKIQNLIEAYVRKLRHNKKVTSSSNAVNPQKT